MTRATEDNRAKRETKEIEGRKVKGDPGVAASPSNREQ